MTAGVSTGADNPISSFTLYVPLAYESVTQTLPALSSAGWSEPLKLAPAGAKLPTGPALAFNAHARIVVVGVCMERDQFEPMFGINKELNLQFVLGYSGEEFSRTFRNLAEGKLNPAPLITGKVGVEGVARAFEDLASPEHHAKILVEPWHG